jgi:integrase/recombinase XerD
MLLEQYLKEREEFKDKDSLIISGKFPYKGVKSRALQLIFTNIKDRVGLTGLDFITMHGCRRWLGSHLVNKNIPIESIRKILGHENCSTTQLYAQMSQEMVKHDYIVGI